MLGRRRANCLWRHDLRWVRAAKGRHDRGKKGGSDRAVRSLEKSGAVVRETRAKECTEARRKRGKVAVG